MGPAPINFVITDNIVNTSMTEILSFYRIKNWLHFSNYYWFNTYCVIVRIISITSIVTLPIRTVLPDASALVCIVARRNRSHTLIARVYKPDIPPKCTEMVWLGILNTQIQFKKIRQFSSSYGDEICQASIRWPARKVERVNKRGQTETD